MNNSVNSTNRNRVTRWYPRVWTFVRSNYSDLITILAGIILISLGFTGNFNQEWSYNAILGLLTLLAISHLLERNVRLEQLKIRLDSVENYLTGRVLEDKFSQQTKEIKEEIKNLSEVGESGLMKIYERYYAIHFEEKLRTAKSSVRILQTWFLRFQDIESDLCKAATNGCDKTLGISRYVVMRSMGITLEENLLRVTSPNCGTYVN